MRSVATVQGLKTQVTLVPFQSFSRFFSSSLFYVYLCYHYYLVLYRCLARANCFLSPSCQIRSIWWRFLRVSRLLFFLVFFQRKGKKNETAVRVTRSFLKMLRTLPVAKQFWKMLLAKQKGCSRSTFVSNISDTDVDVVILTIVN